MNSETGTTVTSLYSRPFLLLCLSHALFAGSFNMMIPELPAYLSEMGGQDYKGYIILLFTITAGLSRPFSGKLADTIGRIPVMFIGTIACVVCSMLYPQLMFVSGFLTLRFFHGFSTGFKPTGTTAYVADVVPIEQRGEAMGILGICLSLGASSSPPLGSWIVTEYGINTMFYASAVFAVLSIVILFNLPETLPSPQRFRWSLLKVGRKDIFDPLAVPAGIVMIFAYFSYGVLLTLVPDLSDHVGLSNRGTFFTIFTLSSAFMRFGAGRLSDRIGRVPVLKGSIWVIAASMIVFAETDVPWKLYLAATLFGIGNGIFSPAINAWTIDLGNPNHKGRAMATMFIALEIAIGGGAGFAGWYFANSSERMPFVFLIAAGWCILGWVYLQFVWKKPKADDVTATE
jgi:MFS family permease